MTGARVTVRMTKLGQPPLEFPATPEAATNKLFRAAQFELPEPGHWEMEVQVEGLHGTAVIDGEVEAAGAAAAMAGNLAVDCLARAGDRSIQCSSNLKATGTRKG